MKRLFCIVLALFALLFVFSACSKGGNSSESSLNVSIGNPEKDYSHLKGTTLSVFNWGEYISDGREDSLDINEEFEKLTGIHVDYSMYDTNESMYSKISSGGTSYDIIIPSDYMVERMVKENMLEKIDFSNIPNYKYISENYKNLYFDIKNEYSVPYMVGLVGLIYNKNLVSETPDSWNFLWNEKYSGQILMINNPRDAFAIAQFALGQNLNNENPDEWKAAAEKLKEQKPLVQAYVMDEVFNKMESGEAAMVPYYAGDFLTMRDTNPDLEMVYPKEGTNIFVDSICIPKDAPNKEAAELYINFLLEPEVALANAEKVGYSSPNTSVLENPNYTYKDNEYLNPDDEYIAKCQYFHNLSDDTLNNMSTLWNEIKTETSSEKSSIVWYAVGIGGLLVVIGGIIFIPKIIKKRKENL